MTVQRWRCDHNIIDHDTHLNRWSEEGWLLLHFNRLCLRKNTVPEHIANTTVDGELAGRRSNSPHHQVVAECNHRSFTFIFDTTLANVVTSYRWRNHKNNGWDHKYSSYLSFFFSSCASILLDEQPVRVISLTDGLAANNKIKLIQELINLLNHLKIKIDIMLLRLMKSLLGDLE